MYGLIAAVAGFFFGWFIGNKMKRGMKAFSTSFIGAFCLLKGVGDLTGTFPNQKEIPSPEEIKANYKSYGAIFGYLAGWIVLTIGGTVVQLKRYPDEEKEGDYFAQ
jgi:hypothetical protein